MHHLKQYDVGRMVAVIIRIVSLMLMDMEAMGNRVRVYQKSSSQFP
jgi:hypothetical protein